MRLRLVRAQRRELAAILLLWNGDKLISRIAELCQARSSHHGLVITALKYFGGPSGDCDSCLRFLLQDWNRGEKKVGNSVKVPLQKNTFVEPYVEYLSEVRENLSECTATRKPTGVGPGSGRACLLPRRPEGLGSPRSNSDRVT